MRIASIRATWVRFPIEAAQQHVSDYGRVASFDAAVVCIETACGLVGWGEAKNAAGSAGSYSGLVAIINGEMAPKLVGRDPRDIGAIWDLLYNGVRAHYGAARGHVFPEMARRGHTLAAISGN